MQQTALLENRKKVIELSLAQTVYNALNENKISMDESQDISRHILIKLDEVKTEQDLYLFLQDLSNKWEIFKGVVKIEEVKQAESTVTSKEIEDIKGKLLQLSAQ